MSPNMSELSLELPTKTNCCFVKVSNKEEVFLLLVVRTSLMQEPSNLLNVELLWEPLVKLLRIILISLS